MLSGAATVAPPHTDAADGQDTWLKRAVKRRQTEGTVDPEASVARFSSYIDF